MRLRLTSQIQNRMAVLSYDQRIYISKRTDSTPLRLPNICPPNLSCSQYTLLKTCMFYLGKHDLKSWGCKLRSFRMEIKSFVETFTNILIKPAKEQTFFPQSQTSMSWLRTWNQGGDVGRANVWKTQKGAVRSVSNIYSLNSTVFSKRLRQNS